MKPTGAWMRLHTARETARYTRCRTRTNEEPREIEWNRSGIGLLFFFLSLLVFLFLLCYFFAFLYSVVGDVVRWLGGPGRIYEPSHIASNAVRWMLFGVANRSLAKNSPTEYVYIYSIQRRNQQREKWRLKVERRRKMVLIFSGFRYLKRRRDCLR